MPLTISATTHKGSVRSHNEDSIAFFDRVLTGSNLEPTIATRPLRDGPILCVLADGVGGHGDGEIASEFAVRSLIEKESDIAGSEDLREAIETVHREICRKNQGMPVPGAMGTTICGVMLEGTRGNWFNVGDSRVYKLGPSTLEQMSIDDVPPGERERRTSARITQCLGGSPRNVPIDVHLGKFLIEYEDKILLASDGLTAFVGDDLILEACSEGDGYSNVSGLLDLALKAGGEDNISIMILEFS